MQTHVLMKYRYIDLRSDTVTLPTPEMRKAIFEAEVGDDVLQEDPSINSLESYSARLLGKEDALFVPSGTFGNQLAIFTHCRRGDEVILSEYTHVVQHEAGASAIIAAVQLRSFRSGLCYPKWPEIESRLRKGENIHYPHTGLIVLENALSEGDVMPLEEMELIYKQASELNIPVHLDGARIFNAAAYMGIDARKIAAFTDSVMFCLSKGLCAPVGSVLVGNKDFIDQARRKRKIMGGGMRQAGFLAAAGLVALQTTVQGLSEDHRKAKILAGLLTAGGLLKMKPSHVKINMFFVRFTKDKYIGLENRFVEILKEHGILTYPPENGWIRFVTHHDVTMKDIEEIEKNLTHIFEELSL